MMRAGISTHRGKFGYQDYNQIYDKQQDQAWQDHTLDVNVLHQIMRHSRSFPEN